MRSASRRQRREVEFLTRFLESFYEPTDRSRLARHLMSEDHFSPDRYVWSRAVADSLTERETAEELIRHTELAALYDQARESRARLRELIDFDSLPPATLAFDDLRKKLMSLVPDDTDTAPEEFAKAVLGDRTMFMSGEREQLAARPGKLGPAEIQGVLETTQKARIADEQSYSVEAVAWFSQRLASGQIRAWKDAEDWNRAFHQASGTESVQLMVDSLPEAFGSNLSESSFGRIRSAILPAAKARAGQWVNWGHDLHVKLARYSEAETAYREAVACDPENAVAWTGLGHLFQYHLERHSEAENAYLEAIGCDPKSPWPWNGLGNLYCDQLGRLPDAVAAFANALKLNPADAGIQQNRVFLRRDFMGEASAARSLMDDFRALPRHENLDTTHLHDALFAAYDSNWGLACEALAQALTLRANGFGPFNTDDWLRASAVLLHLNYGAELLAFLDQRGDTARLRPWVEALRAHYLGDRRALQNIAPEIRTSAAIFYDGIQQRLEKLPDKTRRRPLSTPKATRQKRARA